LEAELGIAKNSSGEPDFLGWEVKQFAVEDFERIESAKPITMMTPEPECWRTATSGFYKDADVAAFIRKFGYADKNDKPDRLNFGGRHVVGQRCPPTGLTMQLVGFGAATGKITDANGEIALVSDRSPAPWAAAGGARLPTSRLATMLAPPAFTEVLRVADPRPTESAFLCVICL